MNRRRPLALLTVTTLALAGLQLTAGSASALLLGQTGPGSSGNSCTGSPDWELIQGSRADGTSYAAPTAGVITSWKFQAAGDPTTLTLRVFRSTGGNVYKAVADGGPLQAVAANQVFSRSVQIPVLAGDKIGIRSTLGSCVVLGGNPGDTLLYHVGTATPLGASNAFTTSGAFGGVPISAVFEADADGDGYGDESQDACPRSAATQAACPAPETQIIKKPKNSSTSPKSRFTFTSSAPGGTFTCSVDAKKARTCTSPASYKCLAPGKHTFTVMATSPYGVADPTPATTKFRVSAQRRGC